MVNKRDLESDQPCKLSHQFIRHITKDFDETLVIGSGAFGTVYKVGMVDSHGKTGLRDFESTSSMSIWCKEFG